MDTKQTKITTMRVDPDIYDKLKVKLSNQGMTVAGWLRVMMRAELNDCVIKYRK